MNYLKTGLASAALLATTWALPAQAAGLPTWGGSLKDEPIQEVVRSSGCYVRGDIGYAWSRDPDVTNDAPFITTDIDNSAVGKLGFGCLRGRLRYDFVVGLHGNNDFEFQPDPIDPFHGSIKSYSLMANLYYDFAMGRFKPYIGAGVGVAYNELSRFFCTPATPTCAPDAFQDGGANLDFAWALMTGIGVDISERMVLDFGYRYINLGGVSSGTGDTNGFTNPVMVVDDLAAHELTVGLRYALR